MATLIQSKQIEGVVTASVIQGDFQASGDISASIISASQIIGVKYGDIEGTPNFVGGSGITITQVGDTYTFTNTGGGGGVGDGISDAVSILQINAYTASNDLVIQRFEATTSSLQTQITSLSSSLSNIEIGTTDFSELTGVPTGLVSSSVQVLGGSDVVSGSVLRTLDGTGVLSGSKTDITHLNQFTSSIQSQVDELILSSSTFITSETDSQTLTIVGDQLTISDGNTITIPTGSGGGVSSWNDLTDIPSGLVSSSTQVVNLLDGENVSLGIISGSELYVSGNVVIGGNVTIGDASSDTISFGSDISSDILPSTDNTYDLGSPSSRFSEIHGTNIYGSINATNNVISSSQQIQDLGFVTSSEGSDITSLNEFTSSYLTDSASFDTRISNIGDHVNIGNLNEFTQSAESRLSQLESATGSYLTSETDNQTLTIVGDQLTISDGNTITIPTGSNVTLPSGLVSSSEQILGGSGILSGSHTDISHLNQFTSSVQTEIDGLSSQTSSYLTELPTDLVSGSVLRTLDGTDVLSGSLVPGTGITIDSSSGDYVITSAGGDGDTSFDGNREVTNTLLGDLFTESFNAGTSGSIQDFLDAVFFPSYAPTATFTTQTSNLNTNLTADGTVIETISITDTVDDSPYVVTISGDDSGVFRVVPTNADSSSWEIQSIDGLIAGTFTYDITVSDKNSASRTYSGRSVEILQANAGTLSTTGTLYIIESATTGPIYLGSNGRGGSQGGVSVSYSPNYGTQSARNFTSSNSLISINSSTGVLSVGDPISGSGNLSGDTITSTIGWNDQYGNSGTSDITVNVTQNIAPDIQFSNSSRLNTNQAVNGGGTLVTISFSDTEGDSINHDSFQFTDTSGQLTATKSGNNYLVTADSNVSGSTNYTIGTTIEDVHGFRSNTESHTFNIVQGGNGTITGDTTIYIVESALTGDSFRDATGFGAGNTADVNVTYSPSAGGQSVQSFSSSNPSILINSSGNMTLGVDLSGSVTQSGATIETLITFQDQYGNIGSGSVTANVFGNLAPSVSFVATSDYNTDTALANSNAGVITISDTETNSPYNVTLSGTNGDSFNVVPQNAASSSWQVQPKSSLSLGTYSIDITVTDNYGEVSTLSNKSIVVTSASDYGVVYVYTSTFGSDAGFSANYVAVMGGSTVNGDTPPEVTSYSANTLSPFFTLKGGSIGDSSITLASSTSMTLRDTISGDVTLDSALQNNGSIIASGTSQVILVYPSGSDMEVPTSIQQSINGVSGGGVPYMNVDSAGWGIQSAQIHSIILDTPHLGYTEWFVLGRQSRDGIGSSFEYRIVNANGGSAPS